SPSPRYVAELRARVGLDARFNATASAFDGLSTIRGRPSSSCAAATPSPSPSPSPSPRRVPSTTSLL
ncbi:MAG: hypothetical protein VX670_11050, partial [Candidatus Latescibacterota bacterium]|nr:hypothetical protein [Candidatus Latescibacterota bacterium]